jgi:hypothetical protein
VTVRIDCPPPGWIPGSTRCAVIHVTRTCFAAWACRNEAQRSHLGEVVIQKPDRRPSMTGSKITAPVLDWSAEYLVLRSDSRVLGVAESFSQCAFALIVW